MSAFAARLDALAAAARQHVPRLPDVSGLARLLPSERTATDREEGELHDPDLHEEDVLDWLGFDRPAP